MPEAAGSVLELGDESILLELERMFTDEGPDRDEAQEALSVTTPEPTDEAAPTGASDAIEIDGADDLDEVPAGRPDELVGAAALAEPVKTGTRHNRRRGRFTPRRVLAAAGATALLGAVVACNPASPPPHVTQKTFTGKSIVHGAEHVAGVAIRAPFDVGHAACLSFFLLVGALPKWSGDEQWADSICGSYVTISNPAGNSSPDVTFGASPGLGNVLNAMIAKAGFNGPGLTGYYFDINSNTARECPLTIISGPKGSRKHPLPPSFVVLARDTGSGWQTKPVIAFAGSPSADQVRTQLHC